MNRNINEETEPQPGPSSIAPQSAKKSKKEKKKDVLKWDQSTTGTIWRTPEWLQTIDAATNIKAPVEYFRTFFSPDILEHIVEQSNLYSVQKNVNSNLNLNSSELEQFLSSLLAMSLVKLSNSRKYWSGKLNCPLVSEVISRDRWEQLNLTCILMIIVNV